LEKPFGSFFLIYFFAVLGLELRASHLLGRCRQMLYHLRHSISPWEFLIKSNTYLLYDQAIPLLGICPTEIKTYTKNTCLKMLTAALFSIYPN
jgi:hypothetical protein